MVYDKIKLENISLKISGKMILKNINLSLQPQKIHVFFGISNRQFWCKFTLIITRVKPTNFNFSHKFFTGYIKSKTTC